METVPSNKKQKSGNRPSSCYLDSANPHHVFPPPRWTRPPAQPESSHWLQPDSTLTSTGPSPAGWMKNPLWPTRQPSSRTAARPTAKEGRPPSSSERWPTSRSKRDWASWTAASPPINRNQRPRTENVYKDLHISPPHHNQFLRIFSFKAKE